MSLNSEEIYREKYLKYKKKYTLALEEMKGGAQITLSEKTKIYFVAKKTYDALKVARAESINPEKCFDERLVKPHMSLLLEKGLMGGWNLIRADKKKAYIELDKPFLGGLKFGIKQEYKPGSGLTDIIEKPFSNTHAEAQLTANAPYILNCFNYTNDVTNKNPLKEIYYLYVQDNKVDYKGQLGQVQKGGADPKYIFCDESAYNSLVYHYGTLTDKPTQVNTSCIEDIVKFPVNGTTATNKYEIVNIGDRGVKTNTGDRYFQFEDKDDVSKETHRQQFGYKTELKKTGIINKTTKDVYIKDLNVIPYQAKKILEFLGLKHVIKYDDKSIANITPTN